jgi:hypothetical protein
MAASNSASIRQQYDTDGFYIHPAAILTPALLARAAKGLDAVRLGEYDTGTPPAGRLWNPGDDPNKLCKIEHPQLANHALREVLRAPELGRLAAAITGASRVQVWWVQLLYKPATPPGALAETTVGWHQDKQYWKEWSEDSELFTAWLALSDVTSHSGPMSFVRQSHRWGLLDQGNFFAQNQQTVRHGIQPPAGARWEEVAAVLPPGGVSFHHRLTFHGSVANTSGAPRASLAIHLRTEKSSTPPGSWVAKYLDHPEICPVIYPQDQA